MPFINLSFRIHVPLRLCRYTPLHVQTSHCYFGEKATAELLDTLATESLIPAGNLLLKLIKEHKGKFKVTFSISGITLELLEKYRPDVLQILKKLVKTKCVEFYGETYHHTLSSLYSLPEFEQQVDLHRKKIKELFGCKPSVFRNTELIYQNKLAAQLQQMEFAGVLTESVDWMLKGRTPNQVFTTPGNEHIRLLLRNYRLSDDIAFRFHDHLWQEHPLTAEKFASWIHAQQSQSSVVTLLFDLATLGMYRKKETGIFDFMEALPNAVFTKEEWQFELPSVILKQVTPQETYNSEQPVSWKDKKEASFAWSENMMQNNMLKKIYSLEKLVTAANDEGITTTWRKLQQADYFYYMADTGTAMIPVNENSTPFTSATEAYENYFNIITDFEIQVIQKTIDSFREKKRLPFTFIF
jgi:alpha-amylase